MSLDSNYCYCYCYYRWEVELLWLTLALTPLARVCFSAYPQRQTPKEQGKEQGKGRINEWKGIRKDNRPPYYGLLVSTSLIPRAQTTMYCF